MDCFRSQPRTPPDQNPGRESGDKRRRLVGSQDACPRVDIRRRPAPPLPRRVLTCDLPAA